MFKIAVTLLLTLRASTPYTVLSSEVQVSMGRSRCNTYFAPPGYDDCKSVDSQVRPTASGVTSAASPATSERSQTKPVVEAGSPNRPAQPAEAASSSSPSHRSSFPNGDSRRGGGRRADNTEGRTGQSSGGGSSTNALNSVGQAPSQGAGGGRAGETAQGPARVGEEQNRDAEKRKGMSVELATQHDGRHATEQQSAPSVAGGERGEGVKAVGKHSMDENEDGISRRQVSGRDDDYVASAMRGGAPKPEVSRPSEVITTDADEGSSSGGSTQKGNGVDQRRHATLYPALLTFIFC